MQRRHRRLFDEVDRKLWQLLALDPRTSQRTLAEHAGVTDDTVAARLRRLREENVIATTVLVDWEAAGWRAGAIARLKVSYGRGDEWLEPLREMVEIHFVATTTGCCDVVLALLAPDLPSLRTALDRAVRLLKEATLLDALVVTASPAFDLTLYTLPLSEWSAADFPAPEPPLDDLDRALLNQLSTAGHESNRELARRLEVSDGTVRARIRRLEEGGLIRIVAGRDPIATGEFGAYAMVFLSLDPGARLEDVLAHPSVTYAHEAIGRTNVVLSLAARDERELARIITRDIRDVTGVRDVEVAHLVKVLQHRIHLVRLP